MYSRADERTPWVEVEHVTASGAVVKTYRWVDVPRVPEELLACVVYIYPSEADAVDDRRFGGTGFLVGVRGVEKDDWGYMHDPWSYYIVTAAHVVVGKGRTVLRINTAKAFETVPLDEEDWYWQQDANGRPKNDLAVCPIDVDLDRFDLKVLSITRALERPPELGPWVPRSTPGDDVGMVGRFVDHGGKRRNEPVVRFGNVSMLPNEPIPSAAGYELVAYLVEMRSRGGHSGSPVIVYHDDFKSEPVRMSTNLDMWPTFPLAHSFPRYELLGIDQGQFPTYLDVVDDQDRKIGRVRERSAMCVVIPSWCLVELLEDERLTDMRRKRSEKDAETAKALEESEEEPLTRASFEATLRKVTRPVKPPKRPER